MLVDTGVLFAAMDRSDAHHDRASRLLSGIDEVALPAPILVELDWLSRARTAPAIDRVLLDVASGAMRIVDPTVDDYRRIRELCTTYADLRLGLVDASIVAIAERLDQETIATLDRRHFSVVRPRHVEAFTLVP